MLRVKGISWQEKSKNQLASEGRGIADRIKGCSSKHDQRGQEVE